MAYRFKRPLKYSSQPTTVDGHRFDSKAEADYYGHLKLLQAAGEVLHIDVHPIATIGHGDRVRLDFLVWHADGRVEFHDVKGATDTREASHFRAVMKRWHHPAAPLVAVCRDGRRGWRPWK